MSLTKVTYSMIQGAFVSVLDYGATGDGTTDDTAAIQAALDYAVTVGGTVFIPKGYYRVTATLNVGLPLYNDSNDLSFVVNRTAPISDATDIAAQNATNKAANVLKKKIDVRGEAGTYLVANFAPSAYRPVLAYNLDNDSYDDTGTISNLSIIAAASYVGGEYDPTVGYTANNLVGVYVGRGCSVSEKMLFAGLGVGFLSQRAYWTTNRDMKAYHCGQGFCISSHNQALAENLNAHTCLTGYKYDGQNGKLSVFGTENCDTDAWIIAADCCVIGPAYLEDVRTTGGSGTYAMQLGQTANGTQITHTKFDGILILATLGTAKESWRFWSVADSTLNNCRNYASPYDIDTASYGAANQCDFTVVSANWFNDAAAEGTWVPFIGDSNGNAFTLDTIVGNYTRIGNQVTAVFTLSWTSIGSATASGLVVTLPIAARNIALAQQSAALGFLSGVDTAVGVKEVVANVTYAGVNPGQSLQFFHVNDNASAVAIPANSCSATGQISGTITYLV